MILPNKWITKALIRLGGCAGWSTPVLFANPWRQVFSRQGPYLQSTLYIHVAYIHRKITKKNISRHVLILNFGNAVVNDNCQNCYQVSINNLSKSLSLRFLKIYRIKTDLCITSGKQTKQGIINGQKNSKSDCTNLLSVWSGISPSARNIIQLFTGNPKWKH